MIEYSDRHGVCWVIVQVSAVIKTVLFFTLTQRIKSKIVLGMTVDSVGMVGVHVSSMVIF